MLQLRNLDLTLYSDTIDLQSHDNPSAKDHSRGQYHLGYSHASSNSVGPHHVQALRDAKQDLYREAQTSPRVGGFEHSSIGPHGQTHMYDEEDEEEDEHAHNGVNGVHHGEGYDDGEGNDSQDEDMDDELLDKISSSPSIEDGKLLWPKRASSMTHEASQVSWSAPTRGISFPPSGPLENHTSCMDSQSFQKTSIDFGDLPELSPWQSRGSTLSPKKYGIPESNSIENIGRYLLPVDDPFLDHETVSDLQDIYSDDHDPDWEDEEMLDDSESSDDQDDVPFEGVDSRFLDSGWGGECLRDVEDIDFEFVYALHTFVATVEGQANATKGDTMVLLDDSNSYWWLVRVVKDGSIGMSERVS